MNLERLMFISQVVIFSYLSVECGPVVAGAGLETLGILRQDPELKSFGRELIDLQAHIWAATGVMWFAVIASGVAFKEFGGISRLQKEIQSIPRRLRELNNTIF